MGEQAYSLPGAAERSRLYKRVLLRGVLWILAGNFVVFVVPKILPLITPFLIALLVAMALNPLVGLIESKLHIPRRISALVLTFVVVTSLSYLLGRLLYTIVVESVSLASNVNFIWGHVTNSFQYVDEKLDWLMNLLPAANADANATVNLFSDSVYTWLQSASKNIMESSVAMVTSLTTRVSGMLIFMLITLLAVYFIVADYPKLYTLARNHIDHHIFRFLQQIKKALTAALFGYMRSQLLLALMAFLIMFAALSLYGQKYALLIAFILGIVDLLPIVGTIAVLLPWGAVEMLSGNMTKGVFLCVLGVGFFILRRVVEPRIVGSQTGLHPLLALAGIFAGMKMGGILGAVLGPVIVMVIVSIGRSGVFDNTVADLRDLYQLGRHALKRKAPPGE